MNKFHLAGIAAIFGCLLHYPLSAQERFICLYKDLSGITRQVSSYSDIPDRFRTSPERQCGELPESTLMDAPDEIELEGSEVDKRIPTSLGDIEARWPRSINRNFKSSPRYAVTDAAKAVSNVIRKSGFPTWVQRRVRELPWKIVFIDNTDNVRIPEMLKSNCHPGWMTPPANIYIASGRIVDGCGTRYSSRNISQQELAEVLIHEMAHVIEFQIVDPRVRPDAIRAEGFATWFETLAADRSRYVRRGTSRKKVRGSATSSLEHVDHDDAFRTKSGQYLSASQYARSASYFMAIENKYGIRGVFDVYERMGKDNVSFTEAVYRELRWDPQTLQEEALKALE